MFEASGQGGLVAASLTLLFPASVVIFADLVRCTAISSGFFGVLVAALFRTAGPFYAIYLNLRHLDKAAFPATVAMIFLIDGTLQLINHAIEGFYILKMLSYLALAVTVTGLGLYFGGKIHTALGRETFVRQNSVLVLGSGTALLMKA